MATIKVTGSELTLELSRGEKFAGLHGDIRVPLSAVQDVSVVADGVANTRGLRAPGLAVPTRTKIGTWRRPGGPAFVVVRRGTPAVRVRLTDGADFDELLVSDPEAPKVAARIREAAGLPAQVAEERVTFRSGDLTLGGTLAFPDGPGPHPTAMIITGSGELDRDANHPKLPIGVSRDLAHALARAGVASFRYDKRGVGESQGTFLATGLYDNVDDARAALAWLRSRTDVDPKAVFVIGHSEGACVATALLGDEAAPEPAGVVLLSGMAKTGEETLTWQTWQIAASLPGPVRALLRLLRVDVIKKQAQAVTRLKATTTDVARMQGRKVNAKWHREFIAFDPKPFLRASHVPLLALTGAKDLQTDPADLDEIAAVAGGPVRTALVPDLTHLLRRDPAAPSLKAYKKLVRMPTDPEVLATVSRWIIHHLPNRNV
ncbi:alpha/beta hydrolase family protein [Sphaerimonospora cavernae]|uniref:Alpha/beta hydrolase family protein n=1 Tax=Sphaerimonospora cavernae TaxID=1740611 RepID=A0ABV6U905_9ACTN